MSAAKAALRDEAEIVVVGGGPSGSTAAAMLAELGHDVLIVDKDEFPREKPCGDGVLYPAVEVAERLGLHEILEANEPIETGRLVFAHRRESVTQFAKAKTRAMPRCITRAVWDSALLGAAQERGARLLRARVEEIDDSGGALRLSAVADGDREPFEIGAGTVVGADGATSRLRRLTSADQAPPTTYAVRQYFTSELPLPPSFDCYFPLEVDGRIFPGYGWVFPIDEHTANIGVGTYREPHRPLKLTHALDTFIEEMRAKEAHRYGDLEPIGQPYGSPVSIRRTLAISSKPGVVLTGDAAGTTHPLTGEGIAFAMLGGEAVAKEVHARSKRLKESPAADFDDTAIWSAFPQLGVDFSAHGRLGALEANRGTAGSSGSVPEPYLDVVKHLQTESAYETGVETTPAGQALAAWDATLGEALESSNRALLESLTTDMPFVKEVIHRSVRARLGPMYAAVALATAGVEAAQSEPAVDAAVVAESGGVLPELLTMLVDRAPSKTMRVNNVLSVLTGDFAASRAFAAAARIGTPAVSALAYAGRQGSEGGMRDASARFDPERTVASWFRAASETNGATTVLATQLGTIVRGGADDSAETLRQLGIELGIAIRLAEEVADFVSDDGTYYGRRAEDLRRGIYPLPVLYAIETEQRLPRLLARHSAEDGSPDEIIEVVSESGALDRAIEECVRRGEAAKSLAASLPGDEGEILAALAGVPADYIASRMPAEGSEETLSTTLS